MIRSVVQAAVGPWRGLRNVLAIAATVGLLALRPRHWPRTTRDVLSRQILFTGVQPFVIVVAIACIVGVSVVLQAQIWLTRVGQRQLLGPLLVMVLVREIAPVLASLVVILYSAGAVAAEMGNMKLSGEVHVLEAQGLDPLVYLVMPRVVAMVIATLGLAIMIVVVSLASGILFGKALGVQASSGQLADQVLKSIGPADLINLVVKSVLAASITGVICCVEGLGVEGASTEVPRATSRGLERSVVGMFIISAAVSILTYL